MDAQALVKRPCIEWEFDVHYIPWLPIGYSCGAGRPIKRLLAAGPNWQIYELTDRGRVLVAESQLAAHWRSAGLLAEGQGIPISFGNEKYSLLASASAYIVTSLVDAPGPKTVDDAMTFAKTLRTTRALLADGSSLQDAIYAEQYARLLPTWTDDSLAGQSAGYDDTVVLGRYLTGGVEVSVRKVRRMRALLPWMPADRFYAVLAAADTDSAHATEEFVQESEFATTGTRFRLPGRPHLEKFFNEHVVDIVREPERYARMGVSFPAAILLHGPPGSGKSFAVEKLVDFLDWPSFSMGAESVGSPYIHETSRKIGELFEKAANSAPAVVIIDEMEALLSDRAAVGSTGLHHVEEVGELLRRIPAAVKQQVLVIAMTNLIELIDPAVLRRGRFDHVIKVEMPERTEVAELIDTLLAPIPLAVDLQRDFLIDELTGRPLSDAAFVVRESGRLAARAGLGFLDQASLAEALGELPAVVPTRRRIGFSS